MMRISRPGRRPIQKTMTRFIVRSDRRSRGISAGFQQRRFVVTGWPGIAWLVVAAVITAGVGCRAYRSVPETIGNDTRCVDAIMCDVDAGAPPEVYPEPPPMPMTLRDPEAFESASYRDVTLLEVIQIAMTNTQVLRDLNATVLRAPEQLASDQTLQLVQTDPQQSIEAALSAFDAQLYAFGKWQNNDRRFNNRFFGGGANAFKQDTHDYVFQLSKRGATGAEVALRSVTDYDANNATGNLTPSAWQTQWHAELRQPLLQGAGVAFNRIAGPAALPGVYNGVLIAKADNDISTAKFRQDARDYVSNVINAYWDLAFAYRDVDAKRAALERSRQTWRSYEAQKASNRRGGSAEALAREQYYRFLSEYQDAIAGKLIQRTQVNNSTSGGTFAGIGGVLAAERRLRLLIGLSIGDEELLRCVDDPLTAPIIFDVESLTAEAIRLRSELQQQRLLVARRQMELLAAKNFLLPELDLVTIYRLRGLGQQLAGDNSAFEEFGSMDYQEYEAGVEFRMPVGFRQAHAAVRNAKLNIARERALLKEQERQVLHDLVACVAEADRAFVQTETNLNRYLAAKDALDALEANREAGLPISLEQLLDAQRRLSESQTRYYQSMAEYTIAAKNVQFESGTLLQDTHVMIAAN
ncbi:TolC family protein [Crateriforma conspicua]|uniref:Outer membrane efflux protein n=1 Tax=Crateriforma conspicua TaxID=2527996 RepID=A0A5C5Y8M0_9PLAN|nr:TolC family protein [Crateriforma conspicua]QDV65763.1 Outer membrane efflux protein [Crateriforma conspicua]TWT71163.1 Outer membrane efflux protein [Crateriforma conspicua]